MPTYSPEIIQLRNDIEQHIGLKLQSPNDFQQLIQQIWSTQHRILSLSTVKRLWGYVESNASPRISTLNILSQFLSYTDWNAYLVALEQRTESESALFEGEGIRSTELTEGDLVEVSWLPNRMCIFRYLGNNHFVVEEVKHAKLHVGDTFNAVAFVIGKPMYLDQLALQDDTITSYVAGKKNGITSVKVINS
jgi:hypothetical protein